MYHGGIITGKDIKTWNRSCGKIYGDSRCSFCKMDEEDYKHMLYDCSRMQEYWKKISEFIEGGEDENRTENNITVQDIYNMFNKYKGKIPG
ncbi:hypothetical protein AX774_g2598, partial [Zancudomyces culisetae]